jgi:hypothetical protein
MGFSFCWECNFFLDKNSCNGGLSMSDLNCQTGSHFFVSLFVCFLRELQITENNAVV